MLNTPIRLLLADDNAPLLRVMQIALDAEPDMEVVCLLESADGLLQAVAANRPDVVVLDLTMPGRQPLEAVSAVTSAYPEVRVIAFSGYDDETTMDGAREAGASGFVSKNADLGKLVEAVRRVAGAQA